MRIFSGNPSTELACPRISLLELNWCREHWKRLYRADLSGHGPGRAGVWPVYGDHRESGRGDGLASPSAGAASWPSGNNRSRRSGSTFDSPGGPNRPNRWHNVGTSPTTSSTERRSLAEHVAPSPTLRSRPACYAWRARRHWLHCFRRPPPSLRSRRRDRWMVRARHDFTNRHHASRATSGASDVSTRLADDGDPANTGSTGQRLASF